MINWIYRGLRNNFIYSINSLCFILVCLSTIRCRNENKTNPPLHSYIPPDYGLIHLSVTNDSLNLPLTENTYNHIKSINVFSHNNNDYIAFHDQRSESINIYNLKLLKPVAKLWLKNLLPKRQLYKNSVWVSDFDSIFVTNKGKMYLLDSFGKKKASFNFLEKSSVALGFTDNTNPVICNNQKLYMGVRPYVKETSFKDLKSWEVLYQFNLQTKKTDLRYNLPEIYHKNIYGYYFLTNSYCYNGDGNFVFSFSADPNIYETNLSSLHKSYWGKSNFQTDPISPVDKDLLARGDGYKNYLAQDSYGAIYYDPYRKRYLRVAKCKIGTSEDDGNNRKKKQSLIILNNNFKIIGETQIDSSILLNTLFFSSDGSIYVRTLSKDEYALHFVRLEYSDMNQQLSKLKSK